MDRSTERSGILHPRQEDSGSRNPEDNRHTCASRHRDRRRNRTEPLGNNRGWQRTAPYRRVCRTRLCRHREPALCLQARRRHIMAQSRQRGQAEIQPTVAGKPYSVSA